MLKKIGLLTFGQGFNFLVNLLFLPYMARALSYEDYGTYGQVLVIITTLIAFLSFGLPQIINVYLSKPETNVKDVLSNNILLCFILGLLGVIFTSVFIDKLSILFNNQAIKLPLQILIWSVIFSLPYNTFCAFLIFQGKILDTILLTIIPNLIKIAGVVFVIFQYKNVESISIVLLVVSFIQLIWCLILTKKHLTFKLNYSLMFKQLREGFPLGLTAIVAMVMLYMDSIMVSNMLGVKEYAIFRNGAFEVPFLGTLYGSVAAIILPEVSKLWFQHKKLEIAELKGKAILNTSLLVYPLLGVLIFYSGQLIKWYFGIAYYESAIIFSIYNFTLIIRVNNYTDILIAANKSRIVLYSNIFVLILNLILNYYLIKEFQSVGAAVSTVISIFILALILMYYNKKIFGAQLIKIYLNSKKLLFVFSLSIFSGLIFCYLIPTYTFIKQYISLQIVLIFISLSLQYIIYYKLKIIDQKLFDVIKQKLK